MIRRRSKTALLLLAGVVLAAALAWRFVDGSRGRAFAAAPDFLLSDIKGGTASLSALRGRVVLVNFWATWCDSCRAEAGVLESAYEKYRARGFCVLAASVDEDSPSHVASFAQKAGWTFPTLLADGKTKQAYGVFGLPASFLVDVDGSIRRKYTGPVEAATLDYDVREALNEAGLKEGKTVVQ